MALELYKYFIRTSLAAFILLAMLRCASVGYPTGGPKDTLPPRIVVMTPQYGTTNFTDKRIYIEFDEYITIKDQQKEYYTSPYMERQPVISQRGRGIQIDFKDTLLENQTYSLNFCSAIRDNNEGNPLNDFRFVFSTGPTIDSMLMSGYTVDAHTGDSLGKSYILFYPATADTTTYDSLPFRAPAAIARAQANGIFLAENLKPIDYRVYALDDRNTNRKYEPGADRIAFLDTVYNPATMPGFAIRWDTTRLYNVPDPQLYLRLFMDEAFRRQNLTTTKRPTQHRIDFQFGAKYPIVESLRLDGIDSTKIITQYLKPTRDSLHLWLNVPSAELPDTIKGEIIYMRHDSLNKLERYTQQLALGWKSFEKKKDKNDTLPPPNPFKYKVEATANLNPFNNIPFFFEQPIVKIDSAAVTLTRIGEEDKQYRARVRFVQDTTDMLRWTLFSQWVADSKYELLIPAGVFTDVAGYQNDTMKASFTVMAAEKYATIELDVAGKTPESTYVLHLVDQSNRVVRELRQVRTGHYTLAYIETGTFKIRILEDLNGNGKWDTGNLISRIQPERTEIFANEKGEAEFTTKENWTLDFSLDMKRIFAPVTMDAMIRRLREAEIARIQKQLKERAGNKPEYRDQSQNQRGSGSVTGGGGIPMPTGFSR